VACSKNKCSGCGSCCNNTHAHADYSAWLSRSSNRSGNCRHGGCSHDHHGCGSCSHHSNCSCTGCNSGRSGCGCSSCGDGWNHGRSGCGKSSCDSGFGLLRGISGPYDRSCCGPRFPFYTGPCGPCEGDCCCEEHCCDPCCDDCCEPCCDDCDEPCCVPCGATFAAAAPVTLAAGDCVELSCTSEQTDHFTATCEGIRIHRAGSYMVIYTVHVPANEIVSGRFMLTLDGDRVASSAAEVSTVANGTSNGYSMHAMVHARAGSLLKLVSMNQLSICPGPCSNVFTLSISKIS